MSIIYFLRNSDLFFFLIFLFFFYNIFLFPFNYNLLSCYYFTLVPFENYSSLKNDSIGVHKDIFYEKFEELMAIIHILKIFTFLLYLQKKIF